MIKTLTVGSLETNCYLVWNDNTKNVLIIDPGEDADYIKSNISNFDLQPKAILATHGHFDHIMASFELKIIYNIPLYLSFNDKFLTKRAKLSYDYFVINSKRKKCQVFNNDLKNPEVSFKQKADYDLDKLKSLNLCNLEIIIIPTPGHTPGSKTFYLKNDRTLFVGDLMFDENLIGSYEHNYSDKNKLLKSISMVRNRFKGVTVYPGHGKPFTL